MRYDSELKELVRKEGIFKALAKEDTFPTSLIQGCKWLDKDIKMIENIFNDLRKEEGDFKAFVFNDGDREVKEDIFNELKDLSTGLFLQIVRLCTTLDKIQTTGKGRQWQ